MNGSEQNNFDGKTPEVDNENLNASFGVSAQADEPVADGNSLSTDKVDFSSSAENPAGVDYSGDTVENAAPAVENTGSVSEGRAALQSEVDARIAELNEVYARRTYFANRRYNRTPLILALIGMIASFVYGIGIVPAVIALILGIVRNAKKPSKTLKWAIIISIVCIILCLAYYAFLLAAMVRVNPVTPSE